MFNYLSGKLIKKNPTNVILDVNGVGYQINISLNTFEKLPEVESDIRIFTVLIPREDSIQLYGFFDEDEKQMFEQLLSISGIGPKVAQSILSGISPDELRNHIIQGNTLALTNIPGVGKKTAERMIVELRDKLTKISPPERIISKDAEEIRIQAYQALITLGYQKQHAEKAIRLALNEINSNNEELNIENLIKKALKELNK
ncbi:MAG: Holliday junction branch migration protein RuvA [Ignavibacteria bacterium]|jgi:Holliday junction DNA helicase RuvA|nr:Holliday junction branch migration protein RuvA [Ignavibacteria bacterium]MDH7528640.1 Holliday junction branch migration protein RuvA [Ignavibacteria bacterium]